MTSKNEYGLSHQQEVFAIAVASGKSLADALRAAYKCDKWQAKSVHERASVVAKNAKVASRIASLAKKAEEEFTIKIGDLLREAARVAFGSIKNVTKPNGDLKLPHELDADTAAAVASFEIDQYGGIKYRFWDKNSAMERLFKHKGLFLLDNKQKTDPLTDLLGALAGKTIGVVSDDDGED